MTWSTNQISPVTPIALYDIGKRHRLLPESVSGMIESYRSLADRCFLFSVLSLGDNGDRPGEVASVIVSNIVDDESADIDLIPFSDYFRDGFQEKIVAAMAPVLAPLFAMHNVRRVQSFVPFSRPRTVRALRACGFSVEGRLRDAAKIRGQEPEDVLVLGLLRKEYRP